MEKTSQGGGTTTTTVTTPTAPAEMPAQQTPDVNVTVDVPAASPLPAAPTVAPIVPA